MHITLVGEGLLVGPLAELSARAGHTVLRIGARALDGSCSLSELVIVAGEREAVSSAVAFVASTMQARAVVVDATTTLDDDQSHGAHTHIPEREWRSLLSTTRLVRAFASVPAAAFAALAQPTRPDVTDLAVPLAGDDVGAKAIVARFMQQIGVYPVDLGPLNVCYVMEPGGPLWGKAVDQLEMLECVGWLSGDG